MKKTISILILVATIWTIALASDFSGSLSVTGGSPQRVSSILTTNGYAGQLTLDEYTICNYGANTIYLGQSNVSSSNGFALPNGACKTERRATQVIDTTAKYIWVTATQNVDFSIR